MGLFMPYFCFLVLCFFWGCGLMVFYVYVLLCCDGSFYTGYTKDVAARLRLHNLGRGARYTRMHKPQKLVYFEEYASRGLAMKRERAIKKLSHQQKQVLTDSKNEK
jgi:putative endonuclease